MKNHIVKDVNDFYYRFNSKNLTKLCKRLTALNDTQAAKKEIAFVENILGGNCVLAGREERGTQRNQIRALSSSINTLRQAVDLTDNTRKDQEAEILHYYNARHLQLFFNNSENWDTWEKEAQHNHNDKKPNNKLTALKELRKKWFSQNAFAIYPAKILLAVQERLDNIRQYAANWRLDLELNWRRLTEKQRQDVKDHIQQVENYADGVLKQLTFAVGLRLEAGVFFKTRKGTIRSIIS